MLEECVQINMQANDKSKITSDFKTLQEWIMPSTQKPIKQFRLLYRASQNGFSVSQFHKRCDGKYDTLVLVKTNYGKIIGGFSHHRWNQVQSKSYYDNSHKTFVFSLTNKLKFPQITTNGEHSIFCNPNYGPTFGGDLHITEKLCRGNLGFSFNNGNFAFNSQQTYTFWSGCPNGSYFTTEQYEVYQVICGQ